MYDDFNLLKLLYFYGYCLVWVININLYALSSVVKVLFRLTYKIRLNFHRIWFAKGIFFVYVEV